MKPAAGFEARRRNQFFHILCVALRTYGSVTTPQKKILKLRATNLAKIFVNWHPKPPI
jgi:hypothetical protein